MEKNNLHFVLTVWLFFSCLSVFAQSTKIQYLSGTGSDYTMVTLSSYSLDQPVREKIFLNKDWLTVADNNNPFSYRGFEAPGYYPKGWKKVDVPHNWDDYGGYRRLMHGNRHGYAWYRKKFHLNKKTKDKHYKKNQEAYTS